MQQIIEDAAQRFKQGDFHAARKLYQKIAACYGESIVAVNLSLCDQAIKALNGQVSMTEGEGTAGENDRAAVNASSLQVTRQLHDTQSLLEKYFVLAQSQK
ncbi:MULTISPECIES: hypothetical protein [unclassified Cobetia]|uniref:hypothetical protein n=1 Tax=unclassified Cobetia TaxID=2609414 RepID=UPI00209723CC|nr:MULTISPECIES: hypothetical protein [unclassified Cobetia]MCO7233451.1 hypothetical protein [Cobetia sp. Dlab-2-AX]MCO7236726.1 hypothetical protein [Cobetia sp. Dlab-2-U]